MADVTHTFAADGTILASEINTNFDDVITMLTSIGPDQLAGGLTADKFTDRFSVSYARQQLFPIAQNVDLSTPLRYEIFNTMTVLSRFHPTLKANTVNYLTHIEVEVVSRTPNSVGLEDAQMDFRLNGTTIIADTKIILDTDDSKYIIARDAPMDNPLTPLSDGDFVDIRIGTENDGAGGGTPAGVRGLTVTFGIKTVLIA